MSGKTLEDEAVHEAVEAVRDALLDDIKDLTDRLAVSIAARKVLERVLGSAQDHITNLEATVKLLGG